MQFDNKEQKVENGIFLSKGFRGVNGVAYEDFFFSDDEMTLSIRGGV